MRVSTRTSLILAIVFALVFDSLHAQQVAFRVCVLPFDAGGEIAKADAETLGRLFETALIKKGEFDIIEQAQREEILKEQEYSLSQCSDEICALRIGRLLSADKIILGNVSSIGTKIIVTAKLIDIESGMSLGAQSVEGTTLDLLTEKMTILADFFTSASSFGGLGKDNSEQSTKVGASLEDSEKERLQENIEGLIRSRDHLANRLSKSVKSRKRFNTYGGVSFSVAAVLSALAGYYWYLSEQAYAEYNNTNVTADATALRNAVERYDDLKLSIGLSGAVSIVIGSVLLASGPRPSFIKDQIQSLDEQIEDLKIEVER